MPEDHSGGGPSPSPSPRQSDHVTTGFFGSPQASPIAQPGSPHSSEAALLAVHTTPPPTSINQFISSIRQPLIKFTGKNQQVKVVVINLNAHANF